MINTKRLDWDNYFLDIAEMVAVRSTCPRLSVGAVIVFNNRIIGTGYNGAESDDDHCKDVGCRTRDGHCTRAVHAEENAISAAIDNSPWETFSGDILKYRTILYVTHTPCRHCIRGAWCYNIRDIRYRAPYGDVIEPETLADLKMKVEQVK